MPPKRKASSKSAAPDAKRAKKSPAASSQVRVPGEMRCWLFKSEPESRFQNGVDMKFSVDDLAAEPEQTACWDGVRNYQARNLMRDQMKCGDIGFFYHSNCKEPGIAGIVKVVKEGYPDHTQFDRKDAHYDPASKREAPRWFMVDVQLVRKVSRFVSLQELKRLHTEHASKGGPLAKMALFLQGRLSVQPVTQEEFDFIVELCDGGTGPAPV